MKLTRRSLFGAVAAAAGAVLGRRREAAQPSIPYTSERVAARDPLACTCSNCELIRSERERVARAFAQDFARRLDEQILGDLT